MTSDRAGELAVRVAGVVVVASVAVALAGLTWRLTGWDDGRDEIVTSEASAPRVAGPDPDVARIVALAPFGGGALASGLPASSLGLILKGVLMAFPPEASVALIAAGDGPALSYGVGAAVAGDAVIETIEVDRVILRTGSGLQVLGFPPPVAGAPAPEGTTPGAGIFITPPPGAVTNPAASPAAAAALAMSSPIASAMAANQAAAKPQPAPAAPTAAELGATAQAGGGYRIGDNPSPELRRLGLQPGDVIETLNGEAVGDVAGDRALAQRALASGGATVVIVRGGRRLTLTFPLR
ncbi:MAG: type II secretion system protein N [Pseudomonadota bacterium]